MTSVLRDRLVPMTPTQRRALIRRIDDDVARVQTRLLECHNQLLAIEAQFKADRRALLRDIRRKTKRPQVTFLLLKVTLRERRVLRVPIAEWRHIQSRGKRVARAQITLAQRRSTRQVQLAAGQTGVFSRSIPMNRKGGWRIKDLRAYGHPDEGDLVKAAEVALQPIRARIATLTATATKLMQSRYQHARVLELAPAERTTAPAKNRRGVPAWALAENQMELALGAPEAPGIPDRPQLRNPDG